MKDISSFIDDIYPSCSLYYTGTDNYIVTVILGDFLNLRNKSEI